MVGNDHLFTTCMRKATRKTHSISDALINAKFALSLHDETVWGDGLFIFYHIFAYLEDANERLNLENFNKLFFHEILYRKKAFEDDLNHYLGENWKSKRKGMALENYLDYLHYLEKDNPELLMAYVYHLYLGLLSGGQILAKKRKFFGHKNTTNSYVDKITNFDGIDIVQLKKDFKAAMNEIAEKMSDEEKDVFIKESNHVFLMNNLIVNSIGGQDRVIRNLLYKASAVIVVVAGIMLAYKMYK